MSSAGSSNRASATRRIRADAAALRRFRRHQYWFNYQADILEAEKELVSDLRRATDREDRWDAWDEWENEIVDADKDYVKEMRKKGYRTGRVTVGG